MREMDIKNIGFVGGGNMASALASGLVNGGLAPTNIMVADPNPQALKHISTLLPGIKTTNNNGDLSQLQTIVLAVKPQIIQQACSDLVMHLTKENPPLVISIVAGTNLVALSKLLGNHQPLVRCMPNTPALVGSGAAALSANTICDATQRKRAELIMEMVGIALWCEETQMDAVTALSGSGPAYYFLMTETLIEAATQSGLPLKLATALAIQTALGAAQLMTNLDNESIAQLRQRVTSPAGTTEAALQNLQHNNFNQVLTQAFLSALKRSVELSATEVM